MASINVTSGSILLDGRLKIRKRIEKHLSGTFKDRSVVIHPTLLSYFKEGDAFSTVKDVHHKHDFPLPSANCITLIQSKNNRLVLVVKLPMQYKDGPGKELEHQETPNIFKELTIKFENADSRDQWLNVIVAECERNYLKDLLCARLSDIGDELFFKEAYQEIWNRILLEWPKLDSIRKIFIHLQGEIELDVIRQTVSRIVHWMRLLLNRTDFTRADATLFVKFLIQAVTNHGFRVLLFLFEPNELFLKDFLKDKGILPTDLSVKRKASSERRTPEEEKAPELLVVDEQDRKILGAKKFLNHVETIAPKDLVLMFEKAHHPLADVDDLKDWPCTSQCTKEKTWNESTLPEPISWEMMYSILHYPAFLPYVLIMKEVDAGINDDTMERVVDLMQDLPQQYYGQSFIALNKGHGKHFLNLANFCKFREMWKIFAANQFNLQSPKDETSHAFAEHVFFQMWGLICHSKPQRLTKMFLLNEFDALNDLREHSILEALHGEIYLRLAQKNDQITKVLRLAGSNLPHESQLSKYKDSKQTAYLNVEKLQFLAGRVVRWIEIITGRPVGSSFPNNSDITSAELAADTDSTLFILFWNLCIENFAFRAFLMTVRPSRNALKQYSTEMWLSRSFNDADLPTQCELALQFVKFLTDSFQPLHSRAFYSFGLLFLHPFTASFTRDEVSVKNGMNAGEIKFRWEEEITWMQQLLEVYGRDWDGFELSYAEIKHGLTETPFLTFQLFWSHFRVKTPVQSLSLLKRIPEDIFYGPFNFYFFAKEFRMNERNVPSPNLEFKNELELVFDTHFISLINMYRLVCGWKLISPISQEGHSITNLFVSATLNILNHPVDQEDKEFVTFFTPAQEFPNLEFVTFKDIMPLLLSAGIKDNNELFTAIFECLQPGIFNRVNGKIFPRVNDTQRAALQSFVKVLFNWLLQFLGLRDLDNSEDEMMNFASLFALVFRQSIYSPSFRAVISLVGVEFGLAQKVASATGEDLTRTAKRLIQRFASVSDIRKDNEIQAQSLGYFLNCHGHPSIEKDITNNYAFKDITWDDELQWLNKNNQNSWVMSFREFQVFVTNPAYLAFGYFVRTRATLNDFVQFQKDFASIPRVLIHANFESYQDYLTKMGVSEHELTSTSVCLEERPIAACHFSLLLKQPIFQGLWKLFAIQSMRPVQFVHKTCLLIWEKVFAQDSVCNLQKMFHFANSGDAYSSVTFVNFLQCKLLVKLNKNADIGIEHLFQENPVEFEAMKKSVADNESFIERSNIDLVIHRILQWTQCLCSTPVSDPDSSASFLQELTAENAVVFVELLEACIQDSLFRVFLFLFLPSTALLQSYVNYLGLTANPAGENIISLIRFISTSIKRPEWKLYRSSLTILSYPKPNADGECNPAWNEEYKWIKELFTKKVEDFRIDWEELKFCLFPSPALSYILLTKMIKLEYRAEIIQAIPAEHLSCSFPLPKVQTPVDYHFYYLCVDERLGDIEPTRTEETVITDVFSKFVKFGLVTDSFVEKILSYALHDTVNPWLLSSYEIMRELMLVAVDGEPQLRLNTLCMFSNLAQIIIDVLYRTANDITFSRSIPIMCRFVELLLFLENTVEHPELCNLIQATKLFKMQPKYLEKVSLSII
jgi:hypothetical protein